MYVQPLDGSLGANSLASAGGGADGESALLTGAPRPPPEITSRVFCPLGCEIAPPTPPAPVSSAARDRCKGSSARSWGCYNN